jgi:hypothetical protein
VLKQLSIEIIRPQLRAVVCSFMLFPAQNITKMFKTLALLPLITSVFSTPTALAETVDVNDKFITKTESEILLDVPYINQVKNLEETEDFWAGGSACGPASLTMVVNDKGASFDLQTVVNRLPTSVYVKGKMFYDLKSGPSYLGYVSNEIEINTTEIYKTLAEGHPIVMNIQNYDGITGHAIVVVGIKGYDGEKAISLVAHDPFKAPYQVFEYINEATLKQSSGWVTPIGIIKPFYVEDYSLATSIAVR